MQRELIDLIHQLHNFAEECRSKGYPTLATDLDRVRNKYLADDSDDTLPIGDEPLSEK